MVKQFIQVSAHKDSQNFAHCSNLGLMSDEKMTAEQALQHLQAMADEYTSKGYTIEWIREDFDAVDEELYGDLFDDEYDGQPDELTEWMDFDPDC
jgi:hypothetical protein